MGAVLVAIALPAAASALTAKYDRLSGLTITAAPGERTRMEAGFFGAPPRGFLPFEYVVTNAGPVVASSGCIPEGSSAKCKITGIRALTVDLSAGTDSLSGATDNSFRFFGSADVKLVATGAVDDVITGAGFDLLDGGAGNDRLRAREGNDILRGGDGDDELLAEVGDDLLDGGLGIDRFDAGPGDDELLARDGVPDTINCGVGTDTLEMDLKDRTPPPSCEKVDVSDRREAPNVRVLGTRVAANRAGVVAVPLACPREVRGGCAGTLSRRGAGAGAAKRRYAISAAAAVRLSLRRPRGARWRVAAVCVPASSRGARSSRASTHDPPDRGAEGSRRRERAASPLRPNGYQRHGLIRGRTGTGHQGHAGRQEQRADLLPDRSRPLRRARRRRPGRRGSGCEIVTVISVSCRLRGPRTITPAARGDRADELEFELDSAGGADAGP